MTSFTALAETAHRLGVPRGQLENFIKADYAPQPRQLAFHAAARRCDHADGPTEVGFGGARGPGKSHSMFAQITLDDAQRFPGLKALLLRKTGKSMKESAEDLRLKVLSSTPHTYSKSTGTIDFPNTSRVLLGHFRTESDIDNYVGLEYDLLGIEEATTLSAQKYRLIRTCCRTSKRGWRPRTYSNANPGGIGHQFYLKRFIRAPKDGDVVFIPATYRDNVFLDPEYRKSLEGLTGWRRAAWLEGDWNVHAGTFFTTFKPKLHVIEPHSLANLGWTYYIAGDYGWAHPTAFLLLAVDNQGDLVVIDGIASSKRLPEAHHNNILEMLAKYGLYQASIRVFVLGTDAWKPNEKGATVADSYRALGWSPQQATMARISGAAEVLHRLGDEEAHIAPTLRIFSNCTGLIDQLPTLQHDPHNLEDVLKVNVDEDGWGGDDWYDTLRYGCMLLAKPKTVRFETLQVPR